MEHQTLLYVGEKGVSFKKGPTNKKIKLPDNLNSADIVRIVSTTGKFAKEVTVEAWREGEKPPHRESLEQLISLRFSNPQEIMKAIKAQTKHIISSTGNPTATLGAQN